LYSYVPFNASLTCATHTGGRTYSYDSAGRLTNYEGAAMTVGGLKLHLALPTGSYAIDSNGNLTNRLAQSLTWNHENRLESYSRTTPAFTESYLYDVDGIRVRKNTNGVNTFYPNRFYEQSGSAITKYYYFGGQRVAMRQGHTTPLIYLYGDHVGSTAYATQQNGAFITEQGYWGYGRYRRGGALPTDHRFTGQKLDGSGLMYYNARYFDPDLGQFISPDPLVPDPTNLFDYNRYMYVRGNPMRYTDPTGHCATLDDGSPDLEKDKGCWDAASEWLATFGMRGYKNESDWYKYFASSASITEDVLRTVLHGHWAPRYQKAGIYHERYNPAPQLHPVTDQDQAFEQFHAQYAPKNVTLDPGALGVATLKAGTVVGKAWRTGGMAACATGVGCPVGSAFVAVGTAYEVVGYATFAVNDVIIPAWNGEYFDASVNVVTEGSLNALESAVPEPVTPYVPWIGVAMDVSEGVCVGADC
jgi:RHS repeat-associated protein